MFKESLSNTSVLSKKGTFLLMLQWAASNNRMHIRSRKGPGYIH